MRTALSWLRSRDGEVRLRPFAAPVTPLTNLDHNPELIHARAPRPALLQFIPRNLHLEGRRPRRLAATRDINHVGAVVPVGTEAGAPPIEFHVTFVPVAGGASLACRNPRQSYRDARRASITGLVSPYRDLERLQSGSTTYIPHEALSCPFRVRHEPHDISCLIADTGDRVARAVNVD